MKRILRHWQGAVLGVLATFAATPALADVASDQRDVFTQMLPIFIVVITIAYAVICIKNHEWKQLFMGSVVGMTAIVVSLYLVDVL